NNQLYTLDLNNSAAAALVGITGLDVPDMAFDPSGLLQAWVVTDPGTGPTADIWAIDKSHVNGSQLTTTGSTSPRLGFAIASDGTVWLKFNDGSQDLLFTWDAVNGLGFVANLTTNGLAAVLAIDPDTGNFYSVDVRNGHSFLQLIDTATGNVTELGDMG